MKGYNRHLNTSLDPSLMDSMHVTVNDILETAMNKFVKIPEHPSKKKKTNKPEAPDDIYIVTFFLHCFEGNIYFCQLCRSKFEVLSLYSL